MNSDKAVEASRQIRRRPQSAVTRNLIVRVTEQVISEFGIARITTRRIAARAGLAEATIFKYFATKDDLVLAALKRRNLCESDILNVVSHLDGTVQENIARAAEATLRHYDHILGAAIAAMADSNLLPRHREWLLKCATVCELPKAIESYINRERLLGRIRSNVEPPLISEILLGVCLRHVFRRLFGGGVLSPTDTKFALGLARRLTSTISTEDCPPERIKESGASGRPGRVPRQKDPASAGRSVKARTGRKVLTARRPS